jgi:thioredoxin-related protein
VTRLLIALALVAVAVVVALVIDRRRPAPPTQPTWAVPSQVDRNDFDRPDAPWLLLVFTSATCSTCAGVWARVRPLERDDTAVQELEATLQRDLHRRYGIDAVPMLLVVDREGVVRGSLVGQASAEEIWAAVGDVRDNAPPAPD